MEVKMYIVDDMMLLKRGRNTVEFRDGMMYWWQGRDLCAMGTANYETAYRFLEGRDEI